MGGRSDERAADERRAAAAQERGRDWEGSVAQGRSALRLCSVPVRGRRAIDECAAVCHTQRVGETGQIGEG